MQKTFTISQHLGFAELFSFNMYLLIRTPIVKRLLIILGIIAGFSVLLNIPGMASDQMMTAASSTFPPLWAPLIVPVFFICSIFILCGYIICFKPQAIQGNTFSFTHWGLEKTGHQTTSIPWRNISTMKETRSFFLLYMRDNQLNDIQVIQKRMFTSEEELSGFRSFMKENISGSAVL